MTLAIVTFHNYSLTVSRSPNNFTVKWDPASTSGPSARYRLTIEAASISYSAEYSVSGDKGTFNFSKLPEIVGTG